MSMEKLVTAARKKGPVCVGLDTQLSFLPEYLLKKNLVDTSELFIQRAASKSSVSGKPYRVKCGALELDSAVWFDMQLQRLRKAGNATP